MGWSGGHWKGCMCERCAGHFRSHNPGYPNTITCGCDFCHTRIVVMQQTQRKSDIALTMKREVGMSSINICERTGCESLVKGRALGGLTLVLSGDTSGNTDNVRRMELCPACVEDVYQVVTTVPLSGRERAYGEPFDPTVVERGDASKTLTDEDLARELFERMMAQVKNKALGSGSDGE